MQHSLPARYSNGQFRANALTDQDRAVGNPFFNIIFTHFLFSIFTQIMYITII